MLISVFAIVHNFITLLFFIAFEDLMQKYIYCLIVIGLLSFIIITNFVYANGETLSSLFVNNTLNKINEL
jgi:hypothetical protein